MHVTLYVVVNVLPPGHIHVYFGLASAKFGMALLLETAGRGLFNRPSVRAPLFVEGLRDRSCEMTEVKLPTSSHWI